jgi:type II secretion system protein D
LERARAADIEPVLSQLLPDDPTIQLVVDGRNNQLLLTGPAEAHRLAAELIASLDRPAADEPSQNAGQVLQSYPYSGSDLAEFAGRLETQLARLGRVRVTADRRTSQLLVLAGSDIHQQVPAEITLLGKTSSRTAASQQRRATLSLNHAKVAQIEPLLTEMLGSQWMARPAQNGIHRYTLIGAGNDRLEVSVHPQSNQFQCEGSGILIGQFEQLITALDSRRDSSGRITRIVPLGIADLSKVQQAVSAYRQPERAKHPGNAPQNASPPLREPQSRRTGRNGELLLAVNQDPSVELPPANQPLPGNMTDLREEDEESPRDLANDVEVEALPELDVIILRGNQRDVDEVIRVIQEIERISAESEPTIDVIPLEHAPGEKLAALITKIKPDLTLGRQGNFSVQALVKPNAILVIGWGEVLKQVQELVRKLDTPVDPQTQLEVFRLRFAPATGIANTVQQFFTNRTGIGTTVVVTPDPRSNSLIVQASPRDLEEVRLLLERIDTDRGAATNELRIFRLRNTLASDLAPVLQEAIGQSATGAAAGTGTGAAAQRRSAALKFLTIDAQGQQLLESGILTDVRITDDPRTNTLLISAPAESMELLAALVNELDSLPASLAQIKVFRIVNGDATELVLMLRALLGLQAGQTPGPQLAGAEGEPSLAALRFSVDTRTNSIIASGSAGDLAIVEAILLRLDDADSQERKSNVYRLKNSPATEVALSINEFLRSQRVIENQAPGAVSAFQQIEREVVVVPEAVSNSLIISATPRYYDEIMRIIEELDAESPKVLIQVLIADITLRNVDEFGIEIGLQDSLLFDRSLIGNQLVNQSTTTLINSQGDVVQQTAQSQNALVPGFNFNNQPLGNTNNPGVQRNSDLVGSQGLSHFSLNRTNGDLGFGGLVLSASSESVSVLLRALKANRRVDVLARPQVMTLDNQPAFIRVGQRVPQITDAQTTQFGLVNSVELIDIGLILGVTPRISPDGVVVMDIDTERSEIDRSVDGVPISAINGQVITSPIFNATTAQTTVSAADGETIILGGLITKSSVKDSRRVPYLSNIPILGALFRYNASDVQRRELLIIMTPHIVRNAADADRLKQEEAARMSWCLADVHKIHGTEGICSLGNCPHCDAQTTVIYPDSDPLGQGQVIHDDAEQIEAGPSLQALPETRINELPAPAEAAPAPRNELP